MSIHPAGMATIEKRALRSLPGSITACDSSNRRCRCAQPPANGFDPLWGRVPAAVAATAQTVAKRTPAWASRTDKSATLSAQPGAPCAPLRADKVPQTVGARHSPEGVENVRRSSSGINMQGSQTQPWRTSSKHDIRGAWCAGRLPTPGGMHHNPRFLGGVATRAGGDGLVRRGQLHGRQRLAATANARAIAENAPLVHRWRRLNESKSQRGHVGTFDVPSSCAQRGTATWNNDVRIHLSTPQREIHGSRKELRRCHAEKGANVPENVPGAPDGPTVSLPMGRC